MYSLPSFVGIAVVQFPVVAVLVVGLILISTPARRLPARSRMLARTGLVILLAEAIASMAWTVVLPMVIAQVGVRDLMHNLGVASAAVTFLLSILVAAGIALLIAALLAAVRDPAAPPSPAAYPPPHPAPRPPDA